MMEFPQSRCENDGSFCVIYDGLKGHWAVSLGQRPG